MYHLQENAQVKHISIPETTRILVTSDIHGNLPFLKGLLARAEFTADDVLILVGDILEKGAQSLDPLVSLKV